MAKPYAPRAPETITLSLPAEAVRSGAPWETGVVEDDDVESSDGPSMSLTVRFEIIDEAEEEPAIDLKKLSMAGNSDLKKFMMRLALKKAMAAKRQEPAPVEIETR